MRQGEDITAELPGVVIIHQRIRGREVETHVHDEHEIFLPLRGEIRVRLESGEELSAGPGKLLYLPPRLRHSFRSSDSGSGERMILIVQPRVWTANEGGEHEALVASTSQLAKELLFHLLLNPETRGAKNLIATLVQVLSETMEAQGKSAGVRDPVHLAGRTKEPRVRQALAYLRENLREEVSVRTLAQEIGVAERSLSRLFLQELGLSPKQVLILFRMNEAEQLLRSGRTSVTDVAFEMGYRSVSQFITQFRKVTGRLPSEVVRR